MPSKTKVAVTACGVVGCVLLAVGVGLIFLFRNMIDSKIKEEVQLKNGSDTFDEWVSPPVPIYFQIWVFDVVNHDEVVQNGATPTVAERGPYTYREHREKVNITFNDNDTVTYREERFFFFEEDMSIGPENETFTTVNIPMVTISNLIRFQYNWVKELTDLVLEGVGETLFMELSISDIMWGYEDKLLKTVDDILEKFNKSIDDQFGLFYNQNGSDDGMYNIYTGVKDSSKFATIGAWNYNESLPYWTTPWTNMLNGTDGTMYPPFSNVNDPLYLFSSDICRSLYLVHQEQYTYKNIDLEGFVAPDAMFWNVTANPDNAGYCTPPGNCLPGGLLNVSSCKQGAPIVMSQPHFLAADKNVTVRVNGLRPDRKQHQTHLGVEPMTGVVMNAAKKLQINIFIEPVDHIKDTEKMHPVFLPVLWLNESAMIDDKDAAKFRNEVDQPIKITEAVQYGLITLGGFLLVCAIAIAIRMALRSETDYHMLKDIGGSQDNHNPIS